MGAVSIGRTKVRIYFRPPDDRGRAARWLLADYSTGKRRLLSFPTEAEAKAEAARVAHLLNSRDHLGASFTGTERADYARALEHLEPTGLDASTAAQLFAEACALVGGHENVIAACKAFARRAPSARTPLPLAKAVLEVIDAKEAKGRSPLQIASLTHRLGRFAEDHPGASLGDFNTGRVQAWLDGLRREDGQPFSPVSRDNFRRAIHAFFEHHRRRGNVADNPVSDVERETITRGEVQFWRPAEAAAVLAHVAEEAKAGLVLGLFCGLRSAEVCRLTWADVDLAAGHVVIGASVAKTASRRLVPIPENAKEWLRPLAGAPTAPIFAGHSTNLPRLVSEACKSADVRRVDNGARHSAITYRVALTGDVARIALECGNSPAVIHGHYRGLATPADAQAYFSIAPESPHEGQENPADSPPRDHA